MAGQQMQRDPTRAAVHAATAPPPAPGESWTARLRQGAVHASQYWWAALLLALPVLGYRFARSREANAVGREDAGNATRRPSRGFRWTLRAIFYGAAAMVIAPMLWGYLSLHQLRRQEECIVNPSACLDGRGLIERVPALATGGADGSEQTRIPCRYVGTWSSTQSTEAMRITLQDDGRYLAVRNSSGAEPTVHDRHEGRWAVQGSHMLWLHHRGDPGRPDVNRIVDESEGRFTLIEENGGRTRFERLEVGTSQRCVR
jgi:hypothetical protein